ncbi:MAG: hypothetical protein WC971_06480 [Coriobacteriia bacterium]
MLHFAEVPIGRAGALHCRRCTTGGGETLRDVSDVAADIAAAVRDWDDGAGPNVSLTGIEPFRHPALADLIAEAVRVGAVRLRLDTDCAALGAPETARATIDAGVRHVRFTLLGSTPELHDALAGVPGGFAATMHGVRTFVETAAETETPVHVAARVPVCRHDLHDLPGTVTAAARAGATSVLLVVEDTDLELRSAAPWLGAACDSGIVNGTWVEVEGVPYGLAPGWELHLAWLYRPVASMKSALCGPCPLDPMCSGAVPGAADSVTSAFRPPVDARSIADAVSRGFSYPEGVVSGG